MRLTASGRARKSRASSKPGCIASLLGAIFPEEVRLAFHPSHRRSVPRPPPRSTPVMAVGQRVFINSTGSPSGSVPLGDESGKILSGVHLADGVEVEVLAWRPRDASGTRYRVGVQDGAGGWLPAANLRKGRVPVPASELPPPPPVPARTTADTSSRPFGQQAHTPSSYSEPLRPSPVGGGRRFGQHFETAHPSVSGSTAPAKPTAVPVVGGGGRRFGQHF
jgi:hypothetical protein